ncbi:MAG: HEAT repeat domain-containing protein [Planctomycetes bacterium]|nr:HEAT repeat domain-containing protein [Planctomycetota bacterium]
MQKKYYFLLIAVVSLFFFFAPLARSPRLIRAQDKAMEEEFRTKMTEGIELFKRGRYKEAYEALEIALRLNPPSDLLRFLRDEMGYHILEEMYGTPELQNTALRIMELSKGARKRFERSPEQIKELINDLDKGFDKRWIAINTLVAVGQRAAPYLIERLGDDKNDEMRFGAIQCLEKMGNEAVLPVIEALNSSSELLRQNSAIVLGTIKDERALAELKRVFEDPDEKPEVKTYVADALQRITRQNIESLPPAYEYYYQLANKYYYGYSSVMVNLYNDYIIWRWDNETDQITLREVPDFTFNEELAEEATYDGLKLNVNHDNLRSLLICIYLATYNESEISLEAIQQKVATGQMDQSIFDKLQKDLSNNPDGILFGQMGSRKYLYQSLKRSLNDRQTSVAISCIKALLNCANAEDLPQPPVIVPPPEQLNKLTSEEQQAWIARRSQWEQSNQLRIGRPLIDALDHSDKRIRYAAAQTLLQISPRQQFPHYEKVMPIMIEALGESGIRVVLVIDNDEQVRNQLRIELKKLNCYVIETATGLEGLRRARKFPSEDLIILNNKIAGQVVFSVNYLNKEITETVLDSLKQDLRTRAVPIFISTPREELDSTKKIFEKESNVKAYLTKPLDKLTLKNAMEDTFSSEEAKQDSKTRADAVAREAAEALANLELVNTVYPYLAAIEGLTNSLNNRPDQIRLPALKALARFHDTRAIAALGNVLANQENTKEIRLASCRALSETFKFNPQSMEQDLYEILMAGIQEDDYDIRQAVARIYGNAQLTPEQRQELFELKRIHK